MRQLTVDNVNMIPDGLAGADQPSTLALEGTPDEGRNLERVMVRDLLVVENSLRRAEDRRRAPEDKTSVAWTRVSKR